MNRSKLFFAGLLLMIAILSVGMVMGVSDSKKADTKLKIKVSSPVHDGDKIKIKLVDSKNKPISKKKVKVSVKDEYGNADYYTLTTNSYGNAKLKLDNGEGAFKVKCKFTGDAKYKPAKKTKWVTVEAEEGSDYDEGAYYSQQAGRTIYSGEVQEGPDGNWYMHVGDNEWVRI
ncbi:MAG: hypothetical protein E7Z79_08445 [Methanobrevibacter thaueri]|jgi:nitrogen fixation protein FixH|uniref:Bacterial Ig-like domain (Group 1) n=1 Tax=Methanobrevibacter thaueri TaxID=190975 RepID=A0A8T3V792_9EURY|nr:hypothetical protein [Methanobrevibacter thaueri]MBE6502452.1 hypothetical protein [Methanobrevibacter thaueri]